jgi:hypothetical protein|tara:strand:- start:892 stop:1203 length:312 start_codon:yes stop_codon:yes gene_type:complete
MKKHMKSADGFYHIKGKKYPFLRGARRQVWAGTAYMTEGGLTRDKLHYNKRGRIVSKKKFNTAKKEKRLQKHGYFTKKGEFGYVKKGTKSKSKSKSSKTKKRR